MAQGTRKRHESATATAILEAARRCLLADGYAAMSTRKVATEAGVPLSQVHYHFGSRANLVLALLADQDRRVLDRQQRMYAADTPLWKRYEQACDFLEDDLESGYVRVLQEMIAAAWSTPAVADKVRMMLQGWFDLLTSVAEEAEQRFGSLGPFAAREIATLIGTSFIGAEALLLLGFDRQRLPMRSALRRVGQLIRELEERR
ncbi:MAG: TetR family transcriptional regulator [Acidimicrobiales bacterium]